MICGGVKMTGEEVRRNVWRDWLKAVGYTALVVVLVAAVVVGSQQLGIR